MTDLDSGLKCIILPTKIQIVKAMVFPAVMYRYESWTFSSVQSLSRVQFFVTPWIAAHQASLSITNSRSSLRLTSIELVMPSSHLILCRPLLLLPPIPPSISLFQWVNSLHEVAKVLDFQLQHRSLQRNPRVDLLQNGLVESPCSPRDSQHSLLEKFKSKLKWDIASHQSEWPSSKSLQTINAGESVEKRVCSCTVGGNVNWNSNYGRQYGDFFKN